MLYTDAMKNHPSATASQAISTPAPATQLTPQNEAVDPSNIWHQTNWDQAAAATALRRAIQSSPARILGTQESPIEIDSDLTTKPTNRMLFPSPRKEGEFKSLEDGPQNKDISIKDAQPAAAPASGSPPTELPEYIQTDKENLPPPIEDDDLAHLFEDFQPTTPGKPSPATTRFIAALLKTPTPNSKRTHSTPRTRRSENSHADDPLLTPMTVHLHKLLTDGTESPLRDITSDMNMPLDFSEYLDATDLDFPIHGGDRELDWTDLPMPSSPPNLESSGNIIDFEFLDSEVPGGSDFGIWEDGSAGPAEAKEAEAVC